MDKRPSSVPVCGRIKRNRPSSQSWDERRLSRYHPSSPAGALHMRAHNMPHPCNGGYPQFPTGIRKTLPEGKGLHTATADRSTDCRMHSEIGLRSELHPFPPPARSQSGTCLPCGVCPGYSSPSLSWPDLGLIQFVQLDYDCIMRVFTCQSASAASGSRFQACMPPLSTFTHSNPDAMRILAAVAALEPDRQMTMIDCFT